MKHIKTAFTTAAGVKLAEALVKEISSGEIFQNWDECIEALTLELADIADKKFGNIPASQFFNAELQDKVSRRLKSGRYCTTVNEE